MKNPTTLQGYQAYYASEQFQRDLLDWFNVSPNVHVHKSASCRPVLWVGACTKGPHRRGIPARTAEESFYFSFCVFFHCLQAQAIFKLSGGAMLYRFHTETLVPFFSCGLGGVMHPCHTLYEANLLPMDGEIPAYIAMLDTIMPALHAQLDELEPYAPKEKLYAYVDREVLAFRSRLEKGEPHPCYLEQYVWYKEPKLVNK